jgi:nanoRNase/pAp phosphatase (c-di-AMP/oligoRNAs hydrolase)
MSKVPEIITTGKTILKYETQQNAMYAKGMAYEAEFEGYKAIVINRAYANSKVFDAVYDPRKHDIMILFGVKPDEIKYTLFCDKPEIDVSKIALKYGGGGHRGAAGFYSEKLLV